MVRHSPLDDLVESLRDSLKDISSECGVALDIEVIALSIGVRSTSEGRADW